jgi:hypothetical protein
MSLRRRSLSCPKEQLQPSFPLGNNHVPREKELFLPQEHGYSSGSNLSPFSLGNNHVLREKELELHRGEILIFFPQVTTMSLGKRRLSCLGSNLSLFFPRGTIMSPRRRSLSCPEEQLKPFFSLGNNHIHKEVFSPKNMVAPQGNLSLAPLGTWLFHMEQFKPRFSFSEFIFIHLICG